MEPIKPGQLEKRIEWVVVLFLDNGESKKLEAKRDSVCHFFKAFHVENDIITLRLDLSDIDKYGNPTLDADFYDKNTNKERSLKGERRDTHHTLSTGEGQRSYCWEFRDYKRPFKVMVGWRSSATATVGVHCSVSSEVKRSTDDLSK